jgi:hypothetical protein
MHRGGILDMGRSWVRIRFSLRRMLVSWCFCVERPETGEWNRSEKRKGRRMFLDELEFSSRKRKSVINQFMTGYLRISAVDCVAGDCAIRCFSVCVFGGLFSCRCGAINVDLLASPKARATLAHWSIQSCCGEKNRKFSGTSGFSMAPRLRPSHFIA